MLSCYITAMPIHVSLCTVVAPAALLQLEPRAEEKVSPIAALLPCTSLHLTSNICIYLYYDVYIYIYVCVYIHIIFSCQTLDNLATASLHVLVFLGLLVTAA